MADSPLQVVVVTPEETVVDTGASYVVTPLFDGEIGIGAGHSPMIGRLGFGTLRITAGGETTAYYVDGGFVQVAEGVVSVMTNRAKPAAELDAVEAQQKLADALAAPPASGEALALRQRAIDQARGQLRAAKSST
ncbi:MAG: ATP synthase F1 subunit epsilon [Planctomycetota bacterium]